MADQEEREGLGFETRAIHAGQPADAATGAVVTPITLSTTFAQRAVGEHQGYEYSRSGNPTRAALEECLASLEQADHGFAYASGLAAEDSVLRLLRPGERIVLGNDAYGGTYRLISKLYGPIGYPWTAARPDRPRRLAGGVAARHPHGVVGVPDQPAAHLHRHRSRRDRRPRERRAGRRRQHLRHALPPAAARARRRHRRPLGHEVPRRPLRRGRRLRRRRRRRAGRADPASPRTPPARCRHPSTATSCCAASRRWPCAWTATARTLAPWSISWSVTPRSSACCTPTPRPPGPRCGRPPDARLRRHGQLRAARR